MKTRPNDFLLGLTVLLMLTVLVGSILFVDPLTRTAGRTVLVAFRHEDGIAPIKEGSPVMLSGAVQVGSVQSISLSQTLEPKPGRQPTLMILVVLEVDPTLTLYGDCAITTSQPPVGGGGQVSIVSIGSPGTGLLGEQVVEGLPPEGFVAAINTLSRRLLAPDGLVERIENIVDRNRAGSVLNLLTASLEDINAVTSALRGEMNPELQRTLLAKVHVIADDLQRVSGSFALQADSQNAAGAVAKLNGALDHLSSTLAQTSNLVESQEPRITRVLEAVEGVTRTLNEDVMPAIRGEFVRDDSNSLLGKLHLGMDRANSSLSNVMEISETGRRILLLNRPLLDRTFVNLKDSSDQLRIGIQQLLLSPWRLLSKPGPDELAQSETFEAARRFAEAATYLDDAAARLQAVVAAAPPGQTRVEADAELREIQESLRAAFERFETAQNYFYQKLK